MRKRPAVYCMESCKDCASVQKQFTDRCMCEDQKQNNEAKKKKHTEYMRQYRMKQTLDKRKQLDDQNNKEQKKKHALYKQKRSLKQSADQKRKRNMLLKCVNKAQIKLNKKDLILILKVSITCLIP